MNESKEQYRYINFGMNNDFQLIQGADTLTCLHYHYEDGRQIIPYETLVLLFPSKNEVTDAKLVWNASKLGLGIIKMNIKKEYQ